MLKVMGDLAMRYIQLISGVGGSGTRGSGASGRAPSATLTGASSSPSGKGKGKAVSRPKKRKSKGLPNFDDADEVEEPAFDFTTMREKAPIYIHNWSVTTTDSGLVRPEFAREVLERRNLPEGMRYVSSMSNEVFAAKGTKYMYKTCTYYMAGMGRLLNMNQSRQEWIGERGNSFTRIEVLQ